MFNRSFWKGRRVFLTGHTGFKGSWLSLWLSAMGADVTGYALDPPTNPSLFEQAGIGGLMRSIIGDIRDFSTMKSAISDCRPEVVFHLAAQSVVKQGYDDPVGTYSTNVMGTVQLFEALRKLKRPCVVVNVTSDKCYENREWAWGYRENEPMGGKDPYSNSKGCAELVTTAYRESYFSPATFDRHGIALGSARAGNAIGGGDWTANQLIPDLMRAFLAGKPCLIRNPSATRPWQFLLEPLRGYLMLAEALSHDPSRFATGWNFGPVESDAKPVSWIADYLVEAWVGAASWTLDGAQHPREAHFLKLDASRAKAELNWQPALPLGQALEWIVEWYLAFRDGGDLQRLTRAQIGRYEALAVAPKGENRPQHEQPEALTGKTN